MSEFIIIYITTASSEEAASIGKALVDERIAACANVLPGMTSIYRWDGKTQSGSEAVLILKTRKNLLAKAEIRIKDLHSYDTPCILAIPVIDGSHPFLQWIEKETSEA